MAKSCDKRDRSKLRTAFGSQVRQLRKTRGLTQFDLAESCDLDRTYIGGIERGQHNPTLENIAKIASCLSVSVSELVRGIDGERT